jgi:hypothetical protein
MPTLNDSGHGKSNYINHSPSPHHSPSGGKSKEDSPERIDLEMQMENQFHELRQKRILRRRKVSDFQLLTKALTRLREREVGIQNKLLR